MEEGLLLRVLEEGRFVRIGGTEEIEVDVRRVYAKYGENVSKAAAALKITRNTPCKYL